MKENTKLYMQLRILRLQMKDVQPPTQKHLGLEDLADIATTLDDIPQPSAQNVEVPGSVQERPSSPNQP